MMRIELLSLQIHNFKCHKFFRASFGQKTQLLGKNGSGKSSIYDAFKWLIEGKSADGRKQFDFRPIDENNKPIAGLVVHVSAQIKVDGNIIKLIKEHKEVVSNGIVTGFNTFCWFNDVPKGVKEYEKEIEAFLPADKMRMLTALDHFCTMEWKNRRKILLEIAGNIAKPQGFDDLIAELAGRSIDDYRAILRERKAKLIADQTGTQARIDENQRTVSSYVVVGDVEALTASKAALTKELENKLTKQREREQSRRVQADKLNQLKSDLVTRQAFLMQDASAVQSYIDEKVGIKAALQINEDALLEVKAAKTKMEIELSTIKLHLSNCLSSRESLRERYNSLQSNKDITICHNCGQTLPEEQLKNVEFKRIEELENITKNASACVKSIEEYTAKRDQLIADLQMVTEEVARHDKMIVCQREQTEKRIAELEKLIKDNVTDYTLDADYNSIKSQITELECSITHFDLVEWKQYQDEIESDQKYLSELNTALENYNTLQTATKRIAELSQWNREIAQQLTTIEMWFSKIEAYIEAESCIISESVNGKFSKANFKLFSPLLKGGSEPCCEVLMNGKPYSELSTGEKILIGIDCVNVLSKYFGLTMPLFIDNTESVTPVIEFDGQTIVLRADAKHETLTVKELVK